MWGSGGVGAGYRFSCEMCLQFSVVLNRRGKDTNGRSIIKWLVEIPRQLSVGYLIGAYVVVLKL